jgi:hypothetical protein
MAKEGSAQKCHVSKGARPILIGGLDAGHHTSVALLDLGGNIVYLDTFIHPQNSQILENITEAGNVAVLSTDRARPPSQARKIAASISAKLVLPAKNMTKKKKRILVEDYIEERKDSPNLPKRRLNDHERAALASAIFAYRRFRPGFKKLEDRVEKENEANLEKMRSQLFLMMIRDI